MMMGVEGNRSYDAVAWGAWEVFRRKGLQARPSSALVKAIHQEYGHLVRSCVDPERRPPPNYVGTWPPPRRWRFTKESLQQLNPRPDLRPRDLALLLLSDPDGAGLSREVPDGYSPPNLQLTPKAEAELAQMPKLAPRERKRGPLLVIVGAKK